MFLGPGIIAPVDTVEGPKFVPLDPPTVDMWKNTSSPLPAPGADGVELNFSMMVEIGKLR